MGNTLNFVWSTSIWSTDNNNNNNNKNNNNGNNKNDNNNSDNGDDDNSNNKVSFKLLFWVRDWKTSIAKQTITAFIKDGQGSILIAAKERKTLRS